MTTIIKADAVDQAWHVGEETLSAFGKVVRVSLIETVYPDAEVLITTRLTRFELSLLPGLEAVFLYKTGMDELPLDELERRKIKVYPSHANGDVVAEHALVLGLCLLHRTVEFDDDMRKGIWFADGCDYFWTSLRGIRAGIVGFGAIGRALCVKLTALGAQTMVLNRSGVYPRGVVKADCLETLVDWCTILFLCLPKTPETIGMIGQAEIERLEGKYLVNISRGELVGQEPLYRALKAGSLLGYASDVWFHTPDKNNRKRPVAACDYPFEALRNVVMSPHSAAHEEKAHGRYVDDAVSRAIAWLKDRDRFEHKNEMKRFSTFEAGT